MCAKMSIFGRTLFIGLFAILATNCEEAHHIDQRILENQPSSYANENDFNETKPIPQLAEDVTKAAPLDTYSISSVDNKGYINISSLLRTNNSDSSPINVQIKSIAEAYIPLSDVNDDARVLERNISQQQPKQDYANTETTIDTEVKDLLDLDTNKKQVLVENHQHPLDSEEPLQIPDKIDKETELIDDGQNTEDELRRHTDANSDSYQSPLAVILISVFVALSVLCYAALLAWRRYLENIYGSRTLLVDAEELAAPSDLRNFSRNRKLIDWASNAAITRDCLLEGPIVTE